MVHCCAKFQNSVKLIFSITSKFLNHEKYYFNSIQFNSIQFNSILYFFLFFSPLAILGQTATGGCNTITVSNIPSYPGDVVVPFNPSGCVTSVQDDCGRISTCSVAKAQLRLERKSGSSWVTVGNWTESLVFNNITTHGTYRVAVRRPQYIITNSCPMDNKIKIFVQGTGQFLGFMGSWSALSYTNEVVVGPTNTSDISYTFIDGGGGNSNPLAFDFGETVRMDASASKNYDTYWLAIIEQGGFNRYRSTGTWQSGQLSANYDLSKFWKGSQNWQFDPLVSYTVQFAVANSQCPTPGGWTNLDKTFFICPAGSGCKELDEEEDTEIAVGPNPTSGYFRIFAADWSEPDQYKMTLHDFSGRLLQQWEQIESTEYDLTSMPAGMYLLHIWKDQKQVLSTKLSIIK